MEFWNDFSKTITDAANNTVKEAEKLTAVAKIKYKINGINGKLDQYYKDIGKLKASERNGETVTDKMYSDLLDRVEEMKSELKTLETELANLRDYTVCPQCGYRMKRGMKFCGRCGENIDHDKKDDGKK